MSGQSNLMTPSRPAFIREQVSLSHFNTFRFDYLADYFALVGSVSELKEAVAWAGANFLPITMIGGGSNLLIKDDVPGLVVVNRITGKQVVFEDEGSVVLSASAGENWHDLVTHTVEQGWFGIENLALIPGTVGAAPVQNIGAYGVEVKDVILRVQVLELASNEVTWIDAQECGFAYRDSHFKSKWKSRFLITAIELRLSKKPIFTLSYGGLSNQIIGEVTLRSVFDTVCSVRRSKLPDPALLANAGSFFKNPVVSADQHRALKSQFPALVSFEFGDGYKLAAGWLIDQAGFKGKRHRGVGVFEKQALVLVNFDETHSDALEELEGMITETVYKRYGVMLEREPIALPASSQKSHTGA